MKLCFNEKYFREYKRSKNSVHEPIPATYQTFQGDDGRKYFQLDTYSKNVEKNFPENLEQSSNKIQFDKETALKFITLLKKELSIS